MPADHGTVDYYHVDPRLSNVGHPGKPSMLL